MTSNRPWSKLKRDIEQPFATELGLQIFCNSYKIGSHGNAIPRFYFQMNKTIFWDFPRMYETGADSFHGWAYDMEFSEVIRSYINTSISEIFNFHIDSKEFRYGNGSLQRGESDLIQILIAADRRFGKEKLLAWFKENPNQYADVVLNERFLKSQLSS